MSKLNRLKNTVTVVALLLGTLSAGAQEYPKMNLRLAHFGPKAFVQSGIDQWWADEIKRRSGGNIKVQIFWTGSAGKALEILNLVGSGAVDLGATPQAYYSNELPLVGATNSVPGVFKTKKAAIMVTRGLIENVPAVKAELVRNNVWPLFFHPMNSYFPLCTKPVKTMADFKGLKIRSFGAFQPVLWKSLGAVGVNVLPSDVYEGLQRGRLDCGFYSKDLYKVTKLYEVAKYLTTAGVGPIATWPIWINYKTWNEKLSPDVKQLFSDVSGEAQQKSLEALDKAEATSLAFMKTKGVKVVEFTDMDKYRKVFPDMLEVWRKNMAGKGLAKEADQVLKYWRQRQSELE